MKDPQLLAAIRFAAWTLMLAKALFVFHIWRFIDVHRPLREQIPWFERGLSGVLVGMIIMPLGWALHQFYWWLVEVARRVGNARVRQWMFEHDLITVVPYFVVYLGIIVMFSGWLEYHVGRWWPVVGGGVVAALIGLGTHAG